MVGSADRVSAVTGGAVLRAGPRIFTGAGRRPRDEKDSGPETTGEEGPETSGRLRRISVPPLAVPAALLAVGVILSVASAVGRAGALFTDTGGYRRTVLDGRAAAAPVYVPPHWQTTGILFGLLSTALAITLATLAVRRPVHTGTAALLAPYGDSSPGISATTSPGWSPGRHCSRC
ncbi:hypothetical protein [Streptomyces malaysiensis]|uniref:hypothetical protein n=1 Tax=Streptomyces malaysiensis TaxID=92644 RepID=UPI00341F3AC7